MPSPGDSHVSRGVANNQPRCRRRQRGSAPGPAGGEVRLERLLRLPGRLLHPGGAPHPALRQPQVQQPEGGRGQHQDRLIVYPQ